MNSEAVYLLLGPELGQKDQFIRQLIARGAPETHRFYAFDTEVGEVLSILRNETLFSSYRLVIFNNAELIKGARDLQLMLEYLAHPAAHATLILASDTVQGVNKRLQKAIPDRNRITFWELFPNQKMGWIRNFFKQADMEIEQEAVSFLLDMVENNTLQLRATCEKLAVFFGAGATVKLKDIEELIYHSKEENVFSLFEKVCLRDFDSVLEVSQTILLSRESEPVQLLGGLYFQFQRLMSFKRLIGANYSPGEAFTRLNLRSKKVQKTYNLGEQNYRLSELKDIILALAQFDWRLRSLSSVLHTHLLQLFLYYAVVRGGAGCWHRS